MNIEQKPKYQLLPTGERIIFTVYDARVLTHFKVKYVAEVYIQNDKASLVKRATLKVTPNSKGKGIFDFSNVADSYVSPDYQGGQVLENSGSDESHVDNTPFTVRYHDIHRIDEYCTAKESIKYLTVLFFFEGASTSNGNVSLDNTPTTSNDYLIFNGVLYDTDILAKSTGSPDFGYNLGYHNLILNSTDDKFLSNGPSKQYVRDGDYATQAFFQNYDLDFSVGGGSATNPIVDSVDVQFYHNGATTGSLLNIPVQANKGGHKSSSSEARTKMLFVGVGIGNLTGSGLTIPTNWDYYTVQAKNDNNNSISQVYEYHKQTDDCRGYETIRLTWLNKYGAWDYYNFNKKSVRTLESTRTTYTQQQGTWNEDAFAIRGRLGGTRQFTNNVKEMISVNTEYITEEEGIWLEELFLSNDVFILESRSTDVANQGVVRKYVQPVLVTDNSHTRKTVANDSLVQYTFNLELSKNRTVQRR
tara:strand:+ start:843 stop:2261 length:1419 start_codon:yes stop_codon:yes gene_type:complete